MPVSESSHLKTVSCILTQDQIRRLRARKEMQSSKLRHVSFSDVCREVVEAGLDKLSRERFSISEASVNQTSEEAA